MLTKNSFWGNTQCWDKIKPYLSSGVSSITWKKPWLCLICEWISHKKVNNQPAESGQENYEVTKKKKIPLEHKAKLLKPHTKPDFDSEETK